ncbi:hypothetical protein EIN_215040 [Entamoeba invadens IP1]|uniref:Uncharacterized protein n=2 Tax=Entamoeba invadens IP1 TaxID=370355 RepID=A0A0A1U7N5_ENTIV|nr:hypothetical protein EIN_215040 [Entamoeba invadens IP1]ELP90351.1 hypothetical protein EIN_215040 [Entamoeba invadens IP1]|eukprot:XP_004257122.1 hypothetical protein EIN_215040 [Entamoeba invadens IP1]
MIPKRVDYVGFTSDKNENCQLKDKIDGVYHSSRCYHALGFYKYEIATENGKHYLMKRSYNTVDCLPGDFDNSDTEKTLCNVCVNGVLTMCYGVDGVPAYVDFTKETADQSTDIEPSKTPEESKTLEQSKTPEENKSEGSTTTSENGDQNNNNNGEDNAFKTLVLLVFIIATMF